MKVLCIIDMQNDFIDGALGTKEAQAIVPNVAKKLADARVSGDKVIFTRDTHKADYLHTQEGTRLPVAHCIKGTPGWELNPKVQKALKDKTYHILEKPTFGSVKLPEYIKEQYNPAELDIELIGLCTDICVVSNALLLKANFPETDISVDASCCAGVTPQSHNAALETMKMCQITVK